MRKGENKMAFKKTTIILIVGALVAFVLSGVVFAAELPQAADPIVDGVLKILVYIQKYSWPVAFLFFIFGLYRFYILGAEQLAHKIIGQRMVVGTAVFLVIDQWLPLLYAFRIVK